MADKPEAIQQRIIDEINASGDCFSQYTYLLERAATLPELSDEEKERAKLVDGCQSSVWFLSSYEDGLMEYRATSDTLLVKGILSVLIEIYSHQKPRDIIETPVEFLAKTELADVLESSRKDGVAAMLAYIVRAAERAIIC